VLGLNYLLLSKVTCIIIADDSGADDKKDKNPMKQLNEESTIIPGIYFILSKIWLKYKNIRIYAIFYSIKL
jgi:hypothetical protein